MLNKEPGLWCNTSIESQQNEKDLEAVHVQDYTTKDDLKELIGTTNTNKMHLPVVLVIDPGSR